MPWRSNWLWVLRSQSAFERALSAYLSGFASINSKFGCQSIVVRAVTWANIVNWLQLRRFKSHHATTALFELAMCWKYEVDDEKHEKKKAIVQCPRRASRFRVHRTSFASNRRLRAPVAFHHDKRKTFPSFAHLFTVCSAQVCSYLKSTRRIDCKSCSRGLFVWSRTGPVCMWLECTRYVTPISFLVVATVPVDRFSLIKQS